MKKERRRLWRSEIEEQLHWNRGGEIAGAQDCIQGPLDGATLGDDGAREGFIRVGGWGGVQVKIVGFRK